MSKKQIQKVVASEEVKNCWLKLQDKNKPQIDAELKKVANILDNIAKNYGVDMVAVSCKIFDPNITQEQFTDYMRDHVASILDKREEMADEAFQKWFNKEFPCCAIVDGVIPSKNDEEKLLRISQRIQSRAEFLGKQYLEKHPGTKPNDPAVLNYIMKYLQQDYCSK